MLVNVEEKHGVIRPVSLYKLKDLWIQKKNVHLMWMKVSFWEWLNQFKVCGYIGSDENYDP